MKQSTFGGTCSTCAHCGVVEGFRREEPFPTRPYIPAKSLGRGGQGGGSVSSAERERSPLRLDTHPIYQSRFPFDRDGV